MQLCLGEHDGRQEGGDDEDDGEDQPGSQGLHLEESMVVSVFSIGFFVCVHS